MLTLYGHPYSRAHRVMWMLKELGVPFNHTPTDFRNGETRAPAFLALNPNGRVPTLVDDGEVLVESLAINLYLAKKFGGDLAPTTLREDALAVQWSFWVVTEVEKPLLCAAANTRLFAPDGRRPDEAAIGLRKLAQPFHVLEHALSASPYLLGDRFTVADLNVSAVMTLIPICGLEVGGYPGMAAWLDRCLARPAAADWKPIMFTIPRPADAASLLAMFL